MTTVAYRDGVMASDSQATDNDIVAGWVRKLGKIGPVLYGWTGGTSRFEPFDQWMRGGMKGDPPPFTKADGSPSDAEAMVVCGPHLLGVHANGIDRMAADYWAIGSGARLALGAMAHGATAEEAVRAAIKHDVYSGGEVRTVRA